MYENYDPYEIALAREIATALHDLDSLPLHLQYVRKYKEEFLRSKLAIALSYPEEQVRTNRAAIYNGLVIKGDRYGDAGH